MRHYRIPATFMRGGTSKGLMIRRADLPLDEAEWLPLFLSMMGSPDPYARQLNGMGGGVSSLSKICLVGPPTRNDADVDYTFVQVAVRDASIDMSGNCGNMLAAVGPFAVDEGLVEAAGDEAHVRVHNTNTGKVIHATFPLSRGGTRYDGDLAIPGVSAPGAPIRLEFLSPGGATTGRFLPTGRLVDTLRLPDGASVEATLMDAGNACAFVRARDLGLTGIEPPAVLDARPDLLERLAAIRLAASLAMGIAASEAEARAKRHVPFVGFVSEAQPFVSTAGVGHAADAMDLTARIISNGQPHQALPLTATLCLAVAARVPGSLVGEVAGPSTGAVRIGMPAGILTADATVEERSGGRSPASASFYRTARRLFRGDVFAEVPGRG